MKAIKAITLWLTGFIILPFILAFTPKGAKKLRWLDGVYGNKSSDGLDGDAGYQARVKNHPWIALAGFILALSLSITGIQYSSLWLSLSGFIITLASFTMFRRYRWLQLRNPINNYLRALGPNGTVLQYTTHIYGHMTVAHMVLEDFSEWVMIDWPLFSRLHIWWGYKLMNDLRPEFNSKHKTGHHFENQMILWPFKNKKANL